ncbi:MAG: tetratricopeptide repeat protein, partial [Planctomycetaceae bacterium]
MLSVGKAYSFGRQATKAGERYLREGLAAWEGIRKESPHDRDALVTLSRAHHWLGWLFKDAGRLREAEVEFRKELAIRAKLTESVPFYDSMTKAYLAEILLSTGRPEDAEPLVLEVIAYREQVLEDFLNDYHQWRRLSIEYSWLGECLDVQERSDEGERALRRSVVIAQKLVTDTCGTAASWLEESSTPTAARSSAASWASSPPRVASSTRQCSTTSWEPSLSTSSFAR